MEKARAEEWRRHGGDDPPIATDAHTPEPGEMDARNGAGVNAVPISKKRQRMEQLIQKSLGMMPKAFEHEAVPTGGSQHASSTRAALIATPGSTASDNIADDASQCHAAAQVRSGGGGGDDDGDDLHITSHQHRPVIARRKQCWTQEEDAKLCDLVKQHGLSQWAVIAAHFPNRDRKRCRERFVNHLDPQLQQLEWTPQEEKQLMDLQRELGSHWATIARKLPGRSPEDVKNRFLASAAKQLAKSPAAQSQASSSSLQASEKEVPVVAAVARAPPKRWSKAEADTLRALVQAHGATNWFFLASQLPGRTDLQCMQQWYQVLDPTIVKGKGTWTKQEDAMLLSKYQELGPKWTQISRFLPGRVGKQCRERYLNHLDPSFSKESWTSEEEAKLVQAYEKHATQWFQIAKELPGRSENAIKNHWHTIVRRKVLRATNNSANSTCNDNPSDS